MNRKIILVLLAMLLVSATGAVAQESDGAPRSAPAASPRPALLIPNQGGCFIAVLKGIYETPPVSSSATGIAMFVLSPDRSKVTYHIEYAGLSDTETNAHIHKAAFGASGSPVYTLPAGNPKDSVQTITAQDLSDLLAGLLYVNIHSATFTGGEIRGQIMPAGGCFSTPLSGAEEVPPTSSTAVGSAIFMLAPDKSKVTYHIEYSGLSTSETVAHIHKGAAGTSGGPIHTLPTGNPKDSTLAISTQDATDLLAGLLYVNIHSATFSGGEIRGQIGPSAGCFTAALSGNNETPDPVTTSAAGTAAFRLAPSDPLTTTRQLVYSIAYTGIVTETAAHVHKAAFGSGGSPIATGTLPAGNPKRGAVALSAQDISDLMSGLLYVNIHSSSFSGGEIRGQIVPGACLIHMPQIAR